MITSMAHLSSTPESSAETGLGAWEYAAQDITSWDEYRFYTSGTLTKVLLGDKTVIGIEDKDGKQTFYQISDKQKKNLQKYMK